MVEDRRKTPLKSGRQRHNDPERRERRRSYRAIHRAANGESTSGRMRHRRSSRCSGGSSKKKTR
jgi:hypothetical protein